MLVWMDLEMTGLDHDRDVIVEIATIVTDDELAIVAEGPDLVVHVDEVAAEQITEDDARRAGAASRDALLALSEFALAAERIALGHAPSAVATIGEAAILAPSRNVVPGRVAFTVDVRDPRSETLDAMEAALGEAAAEIAARRHLEIALTRIWRKEPVPFDPAIVAAIDASAESLGHPRRRIISGAGHDACNLAAKVPAAMIFVPCRAGKSHAPEEWSDREQLAAGAAAIYQAVRALDRSLAAVKRI